METKILTNVSGTTSNSFQVGCRGSSVISGTDIPNNLIGVEGDLYVLKSTPPKIYQKNNVEWFEVGSKHIQTVTDDTTIVCNYPIEVVLCNSLTPLNIVLDTSNSTSGYTVIVKDISNSASSNAIQVGTSDLTLIDGGTTATIATNMGTLSMLFDGNGLWKL